MSLTADIDDNKAVMPEPPIFEIFGSGSRQIAAPTPTPTTTCRPPHRPRRPPTTHLLVVLIVLLLLIVLIVLVILGVLILLLPTHRLRRSYCPHRLHGSRPPPRPGSLPCPAPRPGSVLRILKKI